MNGRAIRTYFPIILALGLLSSSPALAQAPGLTVGFVLDGPWERDQDVRNLVETAIINELKGVRDVHFPEAARILGDWTRSGVRAAVDRLMADPEVNVVVALGVLGSYELASRSYLPKPVVAARVVAPDLLHIPLLFENGAMISGVENLSYITVASPGIQRIMELFRQLVGFDRVTFLVLDSMRQIYPDLQDAVRTLLKDQKLERIDMVFVRDDLGEVYRKLPTDTGAVVVTPLPQLPAEEVRDVFKYLRELKLPTLAVGSRELMEMGAMMGVSAQLLPDQLAKRVAQNVAQIAAGSNPRELPVILDIEQQLVINNAAAASIGFDAASAHQQMAEVESGRQSVEPTMAAVVDDIGEPELQQQPGLTEAELEGRQAAIAEAVRKEIIRVPTYSAFDSLNFRVEGAGRVTLLGYSVDSTVKTEAERRVKKIEQVEEVVNLVEVLPLSGNDDRIRAQAYAAIYGHPALRRYAPGGGFSSMDRRDFVRDLQVGIRSAQITRGPHPIHILVKNGNLALVGHVRSGMDSQIAEVQARSLPGVFSVENHLQVDRD